MKNKLYAGLGILGTGLATLAMTTMTAAAQMSTTTLGTSIDSVNTTTTDYFSVLLTKYWPFLVGFVILVGVWHFGKRILSHFS